MKNAATWKPTKFDCDRPRWRGSRDPRHLGVGSRLISDLVVQRYQTHVPLHARGRLLDLGCGHVPLYAAYAPWVSEVTTLDWTDGEHIDVTGDLSQPLPFADARFDTIVLSDVLEHMTEPHALWREMARVLSPGGAIVMNVPFYYSVHAHPHDYYRYTTFALERFVRTNALELVTLEPVGGLLEILADLYAKALSKVPALGTSLAALVQWAALRWVSTAPGARVARTSSRHFPLGYFLVARRPSLDAAP